jgi:repressor LexA
MFLTEKQLAVLNFIRDFIHDKGISPTLEEMSQYFGVSKITVYEHVKALEEKGAVRKSPNKKRSIEIIALDAAPPPLALPIRGRVAAGAFIEAVPSEETFTLESLSSDMAGCYLLRVQGDSMIDDHICDGDLVLVQETRTARDRDIVVAAVDDELTGAKKDTIKRFFRERDHIRLQPANASMEPIRVHDVEIQGKVIGVIRTRF